MKKPVRFSLLILIFVMIFSVLIPNTKVSANSGTIRVKISMKDAYTKSMTVQLNGDYILSENSKVSLKKGTTYTISVADSNKVRIKGTGVNQVVGSSLTLTRKSSNFSHLLKVNNTIHGNINYLGNMRFTVSSGELVVVNHVPLEQYLYGVVAHEMSNSFPLEALKAQAVCARGYAVKRIKTSGSSDIGDTTAHQVYKGYSPNVTRVIQAVNETQGQVLTYDGKIIDTYYAASNGGQTELPGNTWGGGSTKNKTYPYLAQRDDPYDLENPSSLFQKIYVPKVVSGSKYDAKTSNIDGNFVVQIVNVVNDCNIRGGPSTNDAIVGTAPLGSVYKWISSSTNSKKETWHRIDFNGKNGYVRSDLGKKLPNGRLIYENNVLADMQNKAYIKLTNEGKKITSPTDVKINTVNNLVNGMERWPNTGSRSYVTANASIKVQYYQTGSNNLSKETSLSITLNLMNKNSNGSYVNSHEYLDSRLRLRGIEKAGNDGYYVTNGRYGHGIGMSQRGAQQMAANHGKSYRDILYFYFKDTVLSSDMGEIPRVTSSKHNISGTNITGLSTNLKVSTFLSNIKVEKGSAQLLSAKGSAKTSGVVATGDKLQVKYQGGDAVFRTYDLIIYGDVNGDGQISIIDLLRIQRHLLKISKLSGPSFTAADVSKDGSLTIIDLLRVQRHLLKISSIQQ